MTGARTAGAGAGTAGTGAAGAGAKAPLLVGRGLLKRYAAQGPPALDGVDVALARGRTTALLGPNGAGKTTLIRLLHLLAAPDAGEVRLDGRPVTTDDLPARRRMALVAQDPHMFRGTVRDNAALPLCLRGVARAEADRRVDALLERFDLVPLADRPARRLSGGEAQRLAFARALAPGPDVLFLDEFTANLDWDRLADLEAAVKDHVARGGAALLVSHDLDQVRRLCDDAVVLRGGRVADEGPADAVAAGLPAMWGPGQPLPPPSPAASRSDPAPAGPHEPSGPDDPRDAT